MSRDDVVALIRDEHHAAEILVHMRRKQYQAARVAFVADCPRSMTRLLDAAMRLIEAHETEKRTR